MRRPNRHIGWQQQRDPCYFDSSTRCKAPAPAARPRRATTRGCRKLTVETKWHFRVFRAADSVICVDPVRAPVSMRMDTRTSECRVAAPRSRSREHSASVAIERDSKHPHADSFVRDGDVEHLVDARSFTNSCWPCDRVAATSPSRSSNPAPSHPPHTRAGGSRPNMEGFAATATGDRTVPSPWRAMRLGSKDAARAPPHDSQHSPSSHDRSVPHGIGLPSVLVHGSTSRHDEPREDGQVRSERIASTVDRDTTGHGRPGAQRSSEIRRTLCPGVLGTQASSELR